MVLGSGTGSRFGSEIHALICMSDISPPKLKEGQVQDIRILGVQESESATQFETSQSISGVSDLVVKKSRWVGPKVRGSVSKLWFQYPS